MSEHFAKDLDAAPSALTPTTTPLSAILKTYDKAVGRRALGVRDTSKETWTLDRAGLSGTETLVRSGRDYHATLLSGPLVEEYGQLLDHRWHRDFNGVVSVTKTAEKHPEFVAYDNTTGLVQSASYYDGLIGRDVLRNFDVYFDYGRTMMYLVPNERYRQGWGAG